MEQLGVKEKNVLQLIEEVYSITGFVPSLAVAADALGISKGSVIADIFKRLEVAGEIEYNENRKQYRPKHWRALANCQEPVDIEAEIEKRVREARAFLDAEYKNKNAEVDRIKEQGAERVRKYREKQRANKAKQQKTKG